MTTWELLGIAIVLTLFIMMWVLLALFIIRNNRRKKAAVAMGGIPMDHTSLYFEEYFPTLMRNFDLVTKTRYDEWSSSIEARLGTVDDNIVLVQGQRKKLDARMGKLEGRLDKIEKA